MTRIRFKGFPRYDVAGVSARLTGAPLGTAANVGSLRPLSTHCHMSARRIGSTEAARRRALVSGGSAASALARAERDPGPSARIAQRRLFFVRDRSCGPGSRVFARALHSLVRDTRACVHESVHISAARATNGEGAVVVLI